MVKNLLRKFGDLILPRETLRENPDLKAKDVDRFHDLKHHRPARPRETFSDVRSRITAMLIRNEAKKRVEWKFRLVTLALIVAVCGVVLVLNGTRSMIVTGYHTWQKAKAHEQALEDYAALAAAAQELFNPSFWLKIQDVEPITDADKAESLARLQQIALHDQNVRELLRAMNGEEVEPEQINAELVKRLSQGLSQAQDWEKRVAMAVIQFKELDDEAFAGLRKKITSNTPEATAFNREVRRRKAEAEAAAAVVKKPEPVKETEAAKGSPEPEARPEPEIQPEPVETVKPAPTAAPAVRKPAPKPQAKPTPKGPTLDELKARQKTLAQKYMSGAATAAEEAELFDLNKTLEGR